MKTAEEFLEECKAKWSLDTPENAKQAFINALILYAEQAIDKCVDESKNAINGWICSDVEFDNYNAINNVKELLK